MAAGHKHVMLNLGHGRTGYDGSNHDEHLLHKMRAVSHYAELRFWISIAAYCAVAFSGIFAFIALTDMTSGVRGASGGTVLLLFAGLALRVLAALVIRALLFAFLDVADAAADFRRRGLAEHDRRGL